MSVECFRVVLVLAALAEVPHPHQPRLVCLFGSQIISPKLPFCFSCVWLHSHL